MYSEQDIREARKKQNADMQKRWTDLEEDLIKRTSPETGSEITEALKEMHALLTDGGVVAWFANLYDPKTGGFYYSNSARDTDGFFPDLESTKQALSFFGSSGMAPEFGADAARALPEWFGDGIVRFAKERQNKNGYFYNPQYPKEEADKRMARLGRDLDWGVGLLSMYGEQPTYDTPNGIRGNGLLYDGTPAPDYRKAEKSASSDTKYDPDEFVIEHLRDKESFIAHLESFERDDTVHKNSWYVGNHFESQATQIYERDKVLKARGADYSLCDILAEWFRKHQNKETGAWTLGETVNYDCTNGILKICSTFNRMKREFPLPVRCVETAIKCIKHTTPIPSTCHALNPWYALRNIVDNVERFNSSPDLERVKAEIDELRAYILENCAEMIRKSSAKLSVLKMEDGSFEYAANGNNGSSQGMPVSVNGIHEGNVNAYICTRAVAAHIYGLLGYENMPLFGAADRMEFINILEKSRDEVLDLAK